jgi:HSP20 family molecular chaperone IbpA
MSLFPRFTQEFAPLFRLMDDYDRSLSHPASSSSSSSLHSSNANHHDRNHPSSSLFRELGRSFTPKFDVKEIGDAYELHGEFPGVEQKNIKVEWTDANTLTISGRHEHVREEGTRPSAFIADSSSPNAAAAIKESGEAHTNNTNNNNCNSHSDDAAKAAKQPTVEEADNYASNNEQRVVTTTTNNAANTTSDDAAAERNKPKYWVSERSVGEFHRSFSFPSRVDQDHVKASLKNGVLSVLVPKAKVGTPRRVEIE